MELQALWGASPVGSSAVRGLGPGSAGVAAVGPLRRGLGSLSRGDEWWVVPAVLLPVLLRPVPVELVPVVSFMAVVLLTVDDIAMVVAHLAGRFRPLLESPHLVPGLVDNGGGRVPVVANSPRCCRLLLGILLLLVL